MSKSYRHSQKTFTIHAWKITKLKKNFIPYFGQSAGGGGFELKYLGKFEFKFET